MWQRVALPSLLGLGGALAGAIGLPLLVLWMLDAGGPTSGIPELVGGVTALCIAAGLIVARTRLVATPPSEPAADDPSS